MARAKVVQEVAFSTGGGWLFPLARKAGNAPLAIVVDELEGMPLRARHWREAAGAAQLPTVLAYSVEPLLLLGCKLHGLVNGREL